MIYTFDISLMTVIWLEQNPDCNSRKRSGDLEVQTALHTAMIIVKNDVLSNSVFV